LEEDMIEITVYPDSDVLYINFGYRGIPIDLPIDTIEIRQPPEKRQKETELQETGPQETGLQETGPQIQEEDFLDAQSFGSDLPLDTMAMQNTMGPSAQVRNQRREFIIKADEIHFGREYASITQVVNVGESEQIPIQYYITNLNGTMNVINKIKTKNFELKLLGRRQFLPMQDLLL
jgi:hypothetical protein